jgi:Holliday junction resolvase
MRRAARVDANHAAIVNGLRACGWTVLDLSAVGGGCPDLLCGGSGVNVLLECKDGDKTASRIKLTQDQQTFHTAWRGQTAIVKSLEEAIMVMRLASGMVI